MKQIKRYLLLLLSITALISAAPAFYAAEWQDAKEMIRKHKLPVYGFIDTKALFLAEKTQLATLANSQIELIADQPQLQNYYYINPGNPEKKLILPKGIKVLYRHNKTVLVAGRESFAELREADCDIFPLSGKPFVLPNEDFSAPDFSTKTQNLQISEIISDVRTDSVLSYLKYLQNMQTRFLHAPNRRIVAEKIRLKFIELGCTDAVIDSFFLPSYRAYTDNITYPDSWQYNVVATITGTQTPDQFIVLSGHHDSIVLGQDPFVFAPGADDNGSSVAALWEICRAMKTKNYQPEKSIKFISFTAEEHGLLGSKDYADKVHAAGMKIKAVLNSDLIAYNLDSPADWKVRFIPYAAYPDLHKTAAGMTLLYTSLKVGVGGIENTRSDSYSFVLNGYPAIWYFENPFNPYYHSIEETWDKLDIPYCAEIIKSKFALAIYKNEAPENISNLSVTDIGNGSQLQLKWSRNKDLDFKHYKISVGTATETYTTYYTTVDTVYTISNLQNNQLYFIGLSAVDQDDYEGLVNEKSAKPGVVPTAPQNIQAEPLWQAVQIKWNSNPEMDIASYNVYRSQDNQNFVKINSSPIMQTVFNDNSCSNLNSYLYYRVSALDLSSNESTNSLSSTPVRPVTLNHGIMVIDESANGAGTLTSPDDAMQDQFFTNLTSNCPLVANYDAAANNNKVSLSELGPYSTVIWHNQSVELGSVLSNSQATVKKYLDLGGKMVITADKPGKLLEGNNSYPAIYSLSSLMGGYFGADSADYKATARFSGALPAASGYNYLPVDTTKALTANGFHLKKIETIYPVATAQTIYKYDSEYAPSSSYGIFKNQPVGIYNSTAVYKTALLAVPLYYIEQNEAKKVIEYILKEKFGENVGISNSENTITKQLDLEQNYPNPFNPATVINFALKSASTVSLRIFDLTGREVAVLLQGELPAGQHSCKFNALNLSSGIYFYQLQSGNDKVVRKMILQK